MSSVSADEKADRQDGRSARRDRNKHAVVDAYLDFIREGISRPSVAQVAERSGVSHRSVFRYFADRDEMARVSIQRQQLRLTPLFREPTDRSLSLPERIDQLLRHRSDIFTEVAATARLVRSLAPNQPILQAELDTNRSRFRSALKRTFASEFDRMAKPEAADTLAALDVLTSFECFELLRHDQSLTESRTLRVLRSSMLTLLDRPETGVTRRRVVSRR